MESSFYSQYGEDKVLNDLFNIPKGFCVEIGGYDGVTGSNTLYFEKKGWDCLIIEPIPFYFEQIKNNRACQALNYAVSDTNGFADFFITNSAEQLSSLTPDLNTINNYNLSLEKIQVEKRTLDSILETYPYREINFITIDVEGHELEVLKGFDTEKYKPLVIIIEDNSNGLDRGIEHYLKERNYILFKRTGCNDWYTGIANENILFTLKDVRDVGNLKFRMRFKGKGYNFLKMITPLTLFKLIKRVLKR